jgi:hypothetical protein
MPSRKPEPPPEADGYSILRMSSMVQDVTKKHLFSRDVRHEALASSGVGKFAENMSIFTATSYSYE